jgi:hypothetical protein
VARSVAQRYLVAAFAFTAAATWLGVSVTGGFACLFVFVIAFQAVRVYQRRRRAGARRARSRRESVYIYDPPSAEAQGLSRPVAQGHGRPQRSGRLYDGARESAGWPVVSEATR